MTNVLDLFKIFSPKPKNQILFSDFIRDCAKNSKRSETYKRVYRGLARKIDEFSQEFHYEIYTNSINDSVAEEFIHFLKGQGLRQNTIISLAGKVTTMLRRAERQGYIVNHAISDIQLKTEEVTTVYLSEDELKMIRQVKLTKSSEIVRDIFLVGCYTGLRYSDLKRLTRDNFTTGRMVIKTKKTGVIVDVPIHPAIKPILEKYDYMPPRQKSDQDFNKKIKSICKRAGITEIIRYEFTKGFKKVVQKTPKYMLISSHTARRTLATNMYLSGEALFRIMLITGHTTEESFFRYIRISRSENAKELQKRGFFAGENLNLQKETHTNDTGSN